MKRTKLMMIHIDTDPEIRAPQAEIFTTGALRDILIRRPRREKALIKIIVACLKAAIERLEKDGLLSTLGNTDDA